jgi:hypothetical protein
MTQDRRRDLADRLFWHVVDILSRERDVSDAVANRIAQDTSDAFEDSIEAETYE